MLMKIIFYYIFLLSLLHSSISEKKLESIDDDNGEAKADSSFIPTDEWQEVHEDQHVPQGLHIRMNLKTGLKEAKLLSDDETLKETYELTSVSSSEAIKVGHNDIADPVTVKKNEEELRESVMEALKHIKNDDGSNEQKVVENEPKKKNKFRSYDELKADFEALRLDIKTDTELLRQLIKEYKVLDENVKISILEDLDYLCHQIDNAINFVNLGGIERVIKPGLNSSFVEIRKSVMKLIGSASQSNPQVQIAFLEEGILSHLLRVVAREKDPGVSSKSVFAVSCLVRGFPYGQQRLIESGGFETLREVFQSHDWKVLPLQLKVVSLIQDLITERTTAVGERAQQLSRVDLMESLLRGNWCSAVSSLLEVASFDRRGRRQDMGAALSKGIPLRPDHDMVDKVVSAMGSLVEICQDQFKETLPLLLSLEETYNDLAYKERYQGDDGHDLFGNLANQINFLVQYIHRKKDEL